MPARRSVASARRSATRTIVVATSEKSPLAQVACWRSLTAARSGVGVVVDMRKKVRPVVLSCQQMSAEPHTERRRRGDGERSRQAILREAARLATVEGVDGLSLGRLADAVGMSKSGLFAHFKSKEELQLATIETADEIFEDVIVTPALRADPGVARLEAFADR